MSKSTNVSYTLLCMFLPFQRYTNLQKIPTKSRSRLWTAIFTITSFDDKCKNLQTSFFYIFIFAMVRPVQTKLTDTDGHTNEIAHSYKRNLADLPTNNLSNIDSSSILLTHSLLGCHSLVVAWMQISGCNLNAARWLQLGHCSLVVVRKQLSGCH